MENLYERISKSYEKYSYTSNSEQIFDNEKSENTIRIEFRKNNINSNSLLKIDNKFSFSCSKIYNNLKRFMIEDEKDISSISFQDDSLNANSLKNDLFFRTYFKPPNKEDIFKRFDYLFDCFNNIKKNKFKNTKIRCFINKEDKTQNNQIISQCECIPLIYKGKYCLFFNCEKNGKLVISIENLLKHIFSGNLFSPNKNSIKKTKMSEMNDEIKKFRYLIIKVIRSLSKDLISKFKNYKKYYLIYENESNEGIKNNTLKIISSYFLYVNKKFNAYIYYNIMKRLLFENLDLSEENNCDLKKNIKENLLICEKYIKIGKERIE